MSSDDAPPRCASRHNRPRRSPPSSRDLVAPMLRQHHPRRSRVSVTLDHDGLPPITAFQIYYVAASATLLAFVPLVATTPRRLGRPPPLLGRKTAIPDDHPLAPALLASIDRTAAHGRRRDQSIDDGIKFYKRLSLWVCRSIARLDRVAVEFKIHAELIICGIEE